MVRLIIGVTGMPGSGKSVVAREISRVLGWPIYSMGDIVRAETRRRGYELTSSNIERVARILREEIGEDAVAILLVRELEKEESEGVIVDGMRSLAETRRFRAFAPLCVVAVHASPLTRFRRIMARGRVGDASGWEEFVERDLNNLHLGIGDLIALSDAVIVNEGPLEEALAQARRLAERLVRDEGKDCSGGRY